MYVFDHTLIQEQIYRIPSVKNIMWLSTNYYTIYISLTNLSKKKIGFPLMQKKKKKKGKFIIC